MSVRAIRSGLLLSLLLGAAADPLTAFADRDRDASCQAGKSKGKRASRAGARGSRGSSKTKAAEPARSAAEAEADTSDDLAGLDDAPIVKPEPTPPSKPQTRESSESRREEPPAAVNEEPADAAEPDAEPSSEGEGEQADAAPEPQSAGPEGESAPSVLFEPYAGVGIATRSVRMPAATGVLEVAPGVTPAAEVGLRVTAWPSADFSFFVNLVYQSALGFSVTEHPPLALEKEVRARSERVALEVAPRWRFSSGKLELGVPVGATVRTLWAEVHTSQTPSYSLVGPHVRAEVRLVLGEMLALRLAPELQYIMMVDQDLTTAGVASQGVALGGDASLEAQLSQTWSLRVSYRESHALLGATRGSVTFQDVERYLTLRAVGSF